MQEFIAVFQISKTILFYINYYTLLDNLTPHFATSVTQFCRSKRDFTSAGQGQDCLLPLCSKARKFWKKWDKHHLAELTPDLYAEMCRDLEELKEEYNYLYNGLDENARPYNPRFYFTDLVEFSKQEPKKRRR